MRTLNKTKVEESVQYQSELAQHWELQEVNQTRTNMFWLAAHI
ncbi:MAG: hypothetical protein PHH70_03065 [Candidatus Gracilibacteria bacterium]|nr:hypothetical protein [Candidatus Gracilibacteria bacterium]